MDETKANGTISSDRNAALPKAVRDHVPQQASTRPKATANTPTTLASILQSLTDKALNFLSHASNETLGACLAGLGITTYLVLGRIGLVIIGVAGGVVLQATWTGVRSEPRDEAAKQAEIERRREASIDVARRVLEWRTRKQADQGSKGTRVYASQALSYSEFGPETEEALNVFTDAVIKDYVHYWYDPTIPGENNFPASCRRTFVAFMLSLSGHLQEKRAADAFLDFVTNSSSIIIVFLTELSAALNASPNSTAQDAISTYLQLKPDSSLAYMLDQESQTMKLADASEEILEAYLDPKAYNCPPVHSFLKEVLAQLVLGYTVTLCSEPAWINDWIVYGLEESATTKEVMEMVDAGVEGKPLPKIPEPTAPTDVKPKLAVPEPEVTIAEHKRSRSRAEISMEEAMEEARRLTEMMIADDERRAKQEQERMINSDSGDTSPDQPDDLGLPTPTSSQGDLGRAEEEKNSDEIPSSVSTRPESQQFTNFDQLVPSAQPTALSEAPESNRKEAVMLTIHNARVSIFDDSVPGERASIKAKPATDYLIQIEPSSSAFAGWMIARKYADFETLHEILRRISVITGVNFAHAELPKWRNNTKVALRNELERYLSDAVRLQPLAESEGMKRFLEKDRGLTKSPNGAIKGFGWPTPDAFGKLGGDMMNVLTKAPKQVAGGGKAVIGGVAGLVAGGKKPNGSQTNLARPADISTERPISRASAHRVNGVGSVLAESTSSSISGRVSQDSLRALPSHMTERRSSAATSISEESKAVSPATPTRPASLISQTQSTNTVETSPSSSIAQLPSRDLSLEATMNLPPPPSEISDDYASPTSPSKRSIDTFHPTLAEASMGAMLDADDDPPPMPPRPEATESEAADKTKQPLTERETAVAIELMFAVITQLYTLSSAWNIRRTLLSAAKTFLLRPGNPQLQSIRTLLQTSLFDANLSDSGLAQQIYKLRENSLPTAKELEIWNRDYPPKTDEQKEELRIKARRLLITKGMPQALTSVMGATASGDALGKVFDALQVPEVSRGLIFGLMLQALRIVTH